MHPTYIRAFAIHPGAQAGIEKANGVWGPILSNISALPGITPFQTRAFEFSNYREFFEGAYSELVPQPTTADHRYDRGVIPYDSRLLSAEHLKSPNITSAFRSTGGSVGVQLMAPGPRLGDGIETSANPGWRKAVALIVATRTEELNADGLRDLAPEMGTYINEVNKFASILRTFIPPTDIHRAEAEVRPKHDSLGQSWHQCRLHARRG